MPAVSAAASRHPWPDCCALRSDVGRLVAQSAISQKSHTERDVV